MKFRGEPRREATGTTAKQKALSTPIKAEKVKDLATMNGLKHAHQMMLEMALANVAQNRLIDQTVVDGLDRAWPDGQAEE
jgi:hypothetical protein